MIMIMFEGKKINKIIILKRIFFLLLNEKKITKNHI